ncbi:hypothetical protein, partial [Amaricoccus sp.]|uniref:hypothetical protein n=1 Tax=Amaricoccus sp. TaxID=1872485 RepID=UPI002D183CA6
IGQHSSIRGVVHANAVMRRAFGGTTGVGAALTPCRRGAIPVAARQEALDFGPRGGIMIAT